MPNQHHTARRTAGRTRASHAEPSPTSAMPSALEAARKVLMSQFDVEQDTYIDDRQALDALELYWYGLPTSDKSAVSTELMSLGYKQVGRFNALLAWARDRLQGTAVGRRTSRTNRARRCTSVWTTASAGLPSLGKRR
jgi:hypothetical protein